MNRFTNTAAGLPLFLKFSISALLFAAPIAAAASFRPLDRLYRQHSWASGLSAIPLQIGSRVMGHSGNLRIVSRPGHPPRHVGSEAVISEILPAWIPLPDRFTHIFPGRPMSALLSYTAARDFDIELLERAPDLCVVELNGTLVTDAGICRLRNLKNLFRLGLAFTAITDAALETLAEMPSLKSLDLCGTQITSRGLRFICGLPELDTLDLSETQVTGPGLIELRSLAHLEALSLDHLAIDDADLDILCELPTLQHLRLAGTQITDAGLLKLASLPALRTISITDTRVTEAGILRFETARPHGAIVAR